MNPELVELWATEDAPAPGYEPVGQWRTGPIGAIIAVEVWGRPASGDAIVRIISDADSADPRPMDAGTVTAGGTDQVLLVWTSEARQEHAQSWLDQQETETKRLLANRWGTS